jgi:hypothetical protein
MRKTARVDANQSEIVAMFRALGCSVVHLHTIGQGCPDILVGLQSDKGDRLNILVEIKDGGKSPSRQKLTPDEEKFKSEWQGNYHIVRSPDEVRAIVQVYRLP